MDLNQVLSFLHTERETLERVIASLEELQAITFNTQSPLRGDERVDLGEQERRKVFTPIKRFGADPRKRKPRARSGSKLLDLRDGPPSPDC